MQISEEDAKNKQSKNIKYKNIINLPVLNNSDEVDSSYGSGEELDECISD